MSTAGKVLTVLSALLLIVWAVMISAVAKINENGATALAAKEKSVSDLTESILKSDAETLALRERVNDEQVQREREIRLANARLAAVEAQLTNAQESLARVHFQLENYTKAANAARADLTARLAEKVDLEKALADNGASVKKLQGENDEYLNQLEKLRSDFQQALRRNTEAVQKELQGGKAVKTASARR